MVGADHVGVGAPCAALIGHRRRHVLDDELIFVAEVGPPAEDIGMFGAAERDLGAIDFVPTAPPSTCP